MASRRPRQPKPSFCPVCDQTLGADRAAGDDPRCSACQTALLPVKVAGFWRRVAAGAVDCAILAVTAGPLAWAMASMGDDGGWFAGKSALESLFTVVETDGGTWLLRMTPTLVMAGVYFGLFWHLTGRTPGEKLLRMRVVDRHGHRPDLLRTGIRVAAALVGVVAGTLGWLWIAVDMDRRAWHDWLAGTFVVRDA